ncbi:MAG: hypothetical protein HGA44_17365 [Cellulomonadaceae bacterium]|nr:hypothetical protein [Cellulomonadaceae bacterium]
MAERRVRGYDASRRGGDGAAHANRGGQIRMSVRERVLWPVALVEIVLAVVGAWMQEWLFVFTMVCCATAAFSTIRRERRDPSRGESSLAADGLD